MTEKNKSEELPFCECGCGERVKNLGKRFISGHNSRVNPPGKGKVSWAKGLTKYTNNSIKSMSEKLTGRTKEIHPGVKCQSEKITGRTKENDDSEKRMADKMRGRTKENDEGTRRQSEKMKGRNKENNEGRRKQADKIRGRTKETHEGIKRMAEKQKKMTGELSSAWKGGISFFPYCGKFNNDLKERMREYFGRCCYLCGKNEDDNGKKLDVHHVNYNKMACCEEEIRPLFVLLCMNCHRKTYGDREEWEELFTVSLDYLTHGECFVHKVEETGGEKV